ncbi:MAG: hypothetical protein U1E39_05045 [Planctomycetota bacterium]
MTFRRVRGAALVWVVAATFVGCGRSSPDAGASRATAAVAWDDPMELLQALRAALEVGDGARVVALYDDTDPAVAVKRRFWAAMADEVAALARLRTAYVSKFGAAAWDADENPAKWGTGGDFGLAYVLSRLPAAQVDEEGGTARVGAEKFVFRIVRRGGKYAAFREETFGGNDGEVKMVADGVAKARRAAALVAEANTPADFAARFEALRAE